MTDKTTETKDVAKHECDIICIHQFLFEIGTSRVELQMTFADWVEVPYSVYGTIYGIVYSRSFASRAEAEEFFKNLLPVAKDEVITLMEYI